MPLKIQLETPLCINPTNLVDFFKSTSSSVNIKASA